MYYSNIRSYYPNISPKIANELKNDLFEIVGFDTRITEQTIFQLINIVLDSNGNVRNANVSFKSTWGI